jgi:hypothetical protein
MSVRIEIKENVIQAKIDDQWESGLEQLSSQVLKDCNEYCKQDTGTLIMSSYIHSMLKRGLLIWQTPYAARQYYEIETANTDKNPRASWRWCEVAKQHHGEEWRRMAQLLMSGNGRG